MSYTKRHLTRNERVTYVAKFHWLIWFNAFWLCIFIVGFFMQLHLVTTEMIVTNKRFIHKRGWIARKTEEINVNRIEEVNVRQSILGRILGYGTVHIRGTGGSPIQLRGILAPTKLQQALFAAMP